MHLGLSKHHQVPKDKPGQGSSQLIKREETFFDYYFFQNLFKLFRKEKDFILKVNWETICFLVGRFLYLEIQIK